MIQLGKKPPSNRADIERVRDKVEEMLPPAMDEVAVMVNQVRPLTSARYTTTPGVARRHRTVPHPAAMPRTDRVQRAWMPAGGDCHLVACRRSTEEVQGL